MRTTKKDFEKFKETFLAYANKLGLHQYKFYFQHKILDNSFAELYMDENGKLVTVAMSLNVGGFDAECFNPEEHAKHEAIHLLLCRIQYLAERRCVREKEIDEEIEALARKLEKVIP